MNELNDIKARVLAHIEGRKSWGKMYGKLGNTRAAKRLLDDLIYLNDNGFLELTEVDKADVTKANRQTAAAKAQNAKLVKKNTELKASLEELERTLAEFTKG